MKKHEDGSITLTRQELYDNVWATPMRHLAKEFGLSDVGLAKWCKKFEIPKPGVGYWAKKEFGKRVRRTPLPKQPDPDEDVMSYWPPEARTTKPVLESTPEIDDLAAKENRIRVPQRLVSPHPIVERLVREAQRKKPQDERQSSWSQQGMKCLVVSDDLRRRAFRILDTVLKALESRGYDVKEAGNGVREGIVAKIDGESVTFNLREKCRQVKVERVSHSRYDSILGTRYDIAYEATGMLMLEITDYASDVRRSFRDGKRNRVEDLLNKFIISLLRVADHQRAWRKRVEEERIQREAERRAAEEERERMRQEQERLRVLEAEADTWHRSQKIRRYVESVRASDGALQPKRGESWCLWALSQADRIDPLVASEAKTAVASSPMKSGERGPYQSIRPTSSTPGYAEP